MNSSNQIKTAWNHLYKLLKQSPEREEFDYAAWEQELGRAIPEEIKAFYEGAGFEEEIYIFGGQEGFYFPISPEHAYDEWRMWVDLAKEDPSITEDAHYWQMTWLPLAISGGGDSLCAMLEGGGIIEMLHDSDERDVYASSLLDMMRRGYKDLKSGIFDKEDKDWEKRKSEVKATMPPEAADAEVAQKVQITNYATQIRDFHEKAKAGPGVIHELLLGNGFMLKAFAQDETVSVSLPANGDDLFEGNWVRPVAEIFFGKLDLTYMDFSATLGGEAVPSKDTVLTGPRV